MMKKKKSFAFGKTIYFLGVNDYGENVWLEEATWDCGWYWGFGYLETYTNNRNPSKSKDISSHTHFDSICFKEVNGKYIYHINEILSTPLSDSESWELSDLMKRFYSLKETAAIFTNGNGHYSSENSHDSKNEEMAKYINAKELPKIFQAIYKILSPD